MNRRPSPGPSRQALWALVLVVLLAHALLLWGGGAPQTLRLASPSETSTVQMRLLPAPPASPVSPRPAPVRPVSSVAPLSPNAQPQAGTDAPVSQSASEPVEAAAPPSAGASEPVVPVLMGEAGQRPLPASDSAATRPALESMPAPTTAAAVQPTLTPWPAIPLGAWPDSRVLSYQLTGLDKGLTYHASGELRWQHNQNDYELTLSVRAFLIGRRQWRSVGRIESSGLAPQRFSDSWRQERAAHFDRLQQRIVFSSTSTPAVLEPGAQDQISLYVQLAAAMAGAAEPFETGTRLQVQTATVRDAQPWSLMLQGGEHLTLDGQAVPVLKWVCQPRNRFEARVEFWVSAASAWLPLRIRITQSNGSYIDLAYRGTEALPPLPAQGDAKAHTAPS